MENIIKTGGSYWTQTYKGGVYDYRSAADSTKITVGTIAHSLAHMRRFLCHSRWNYSVAEHSVLVATIGEQLLTDPMQRIRARPYLLLHDAHEAFVGDMPAPLKRYIKEEYGFDFKELEHQADVRIRRDLGLPVSIPVWMKEIIGEADLYALKLEREAFMASNHEWTIDAIAIPSNIRIPIQQPTPGSKFSRIFQNAIVGAIKEYNANASNWL